MSRFATPFLVVNLGAEMVFVVAQRLQAQGVDHERSALVLDEIISVLISPQFLNEIHRPHTAIAHQALKELIDGVAQSSLMRLDTKSMDKLWDLITMVFKWQMSHSDDLFKLTQRHLYEIENFVIHEATQLQLHKVQNQFDGYTTTLSDAESSELRRAIALWLRDFHVRVSLLVRIGLQDSDGHFVTEDLSPFAQDMLRNLGENIYTISHAQREDSKADEKKMHRDNERTDENCNEARELDMLADQLKGPTHVAGNSSGNVLKLSINHKDTNIRNHFDNISATWRHCKEDNNNVRRLTNFFEDLQLTTDEYQNHNNDENLQEDLINMIENGDQ